MQLFSTTSCPLADKSDYNAALITVRHYVTSFSLAEKKKKKECLPGLFLNSLTLSFTLYPLNSFYSKVPIVRASMRREELLLHHQGKRLFIQYPNLVLMQHYASFVP